MTYSHTGFLVLKELGFVVDKYVASEIDIDAVNVSSVRALCLQSLSHFPNRCLVSNTRSSFMLVPWSGSQRRR